MGCGLVVAWTSSFELRLQAWMEMAAIECDEDG